MSLLGVMVISAAVLLIAYFTYGSLLAKLLRLNRDAPTPAVEMRDGLDYEPTKPGFLLGQHFSAIAAAGPIVGPILAGVWFGWLPALIWIIVGSILIGGVHDMTSLIASVRHKGRSIAEVIRQHMTRRSYVLFLTFVWLALLYIIVAFTDIVAGSFVSGHDVSETIKVPRGAIATSSLLYLALPIVMGLLLRYTKIGLAWVTIIFLPLVGVAVWVGQYMPLDLTILLGVEAAAAQKIWDVLLLGYCFAASLAPVWLLLQPRGHLGGFFLIFALVGGALGAIFGGQAIEYPAWLGWESAAGQPLMPILFITIACGACSGFHCIIASGTTSKQLARETDAKPIGYGAMLMEAMVAVLSLACVMILTKDAAAANRNPDFLYAQGLSRFMGALGVPVLFGLLFGFLAFTTFVYDTLDVCTRLGRFVVQELTGLHNAAGRWIGTAVTAGAPVLFIMNTSTDASGKAIPAWRVFWALFGASNQLLAAMALLAVTVWLWRTRRAAWVFIVAGLPAAWMYTVSIWALLRFVRDGFIDKAGLFSMPANPVPWVALVLVGLAAMIMVEAIVAFIRPSPMAGSPSPALAGT